MRFNLLRTSSLLVSLLLYAVSLQAQLTLVWPKADLIFQRRFGSAPVKFVINAADNQGISAIQLRFRRYEVYGGTQLTNATDPRPGGQGMSSDGWITLSLEAGQGTCQVRGQLTINEGMYQVEARDGSNAGRTASGVSFGVGEVFAIAGQSNAAGYLKQDNQGGLGVDYPTFVKFKNEKDNFDSNDPGGSSLPNDRNFVWYWGRVGDGLARQLRVPIAFYQTAVSGTGIEDWNSTVTRFPQNYVYYNLQKFLTVQAKRTGVRGVLWHQGEGNNPNAPFFNNVNYADQLANLIQRTRNDGGSSLAWVVAQATYNSGQVDNRSITVHQAQKRVIGYQAHTDVGFAGTVKNYGDDYPGPYNLSSIFSGPDTDLLTGSTYRLPDLTHFNYNGQVTVAERWLQSLITAYNGSNFFDRSYPLLNDGQVDVSNPSCGGGGTPTPNPPTGTNYITVAPNCQAGTLNVTGRLASTNRINIHVLKDGAIVGVIADQVGPSFNQNYPLNGAGSYAARVMEVNNDNNQIVSNATAVNCSTNPNPNPPTPPPTGSNNISLTPNCGNGTMTVSGYLASNNRVNIHVLKNGAIVSVVADLVGPSFSVSVPNNGAGSYMVRAMEVNNDNNQVTANATISCSYRIGVSAEQDSFATVVYPNPAQDKVTVKFLRQTAGQATLRFLSTAGSVLTQHKYAGQPGLNTVDVNLPGSEATGGLLLLELTSEGQRVVHKIVRQ